MPLNIATYGGALFFCLIKASGKIISFINKKVKNIIKILYSTTVLILEIFKYERFILFILVNIYRNSVNGMFMNFSAFPYKKGFKLIFNKTFMIHYFQRHPREWEKFYILLFQYSQRKSEKFI